MKAQIVVTLALIGVIGVVVLTRTGAIGETGTRAASGDWTPVLPTAKLAEVDVLLAQSEREAIVFEEPIQEPIQEQASPMPAGSNLFRDDPTRFPGVTEIVKDARYNPNGKRLDTQEMAELRALLQELNRELDQAMKIMGEEQVKYGKELVAQGLSVTNENGRYRNPDRRSGAVTMSFGGGGGSSKGVYFNRNDVPQLAELVEERRRLKQYGLEKIQAFINHQGD